MQTKLRFCQLFVVEPKKIRKKLAILGKINKINKSLLTFYFFNLNKIMNMDYIKGRWNQLTGKIKEEFGDLTDNEIMEAEGKAEKLAGQLQAKYGKTKEEAMDAANRIMSEINAGIESAKEEIKAKL